MIFLFNYDDYQSVSNCKLEKRMLCIQLSLKAWLLCIIDVIFSIEPVMINDFSWFEILLSLFKDFQCFVISFWRSITHRGAGRSPANCGFGPLVRFWSNLFFESLSYLQNFKKYLGVQPPQKGPFWGGVFWLRA